MPYPSLSSLLSLPSTLPSIFSLSGPRAGEARSGDQHGQEEARGKRRGRSGLGATAECRASRSRRVAGGNTARPRAGCGVAIPLWQWRSKPQAPARMALSGAGAGVRRMEAAGASRASWAPLRLQAGARGWECLGQGWCAAALSASGPPSAGLACSVLTASEST